MTASIRTPRLELIRATVEILESDIHDKKELARLLRAEIPAAWPPPLLDESVLCAFLGMCTDTGESRFSTWYWVRDEPDAGSRTLIGSGGVLPMESAPDTVMLGYSVLDEFQNRGYATEAIRCLIPHFFSLPGIRRIAATTCPDLGTSIRVLEKNGFTKIDLPLSGTGAEEGTVCYVLEKRTS
jgi:RimJ/RimL family protein N-acetyltransferase